jgi:hybrid cluster-associated redox disulfide protein
LHGGQFNRRAGYEVCASATFISDLALFYDLGIEGSMKGKRLDDPDLSLGELMTTWPETIPVFLRHKMLCVGCLVNPFHTVIDACAEYELDRDDFYRELHAALAPTT